MSDNQLPVALYPSLTGLDTCKNIQKYIEEQVKITCPLIGHPTKNSEVTDEYIILNYGSGYLKSKALSRPNVLNRPAYVRNAIDKTKTFELLNQHEVPSLEWTTSVLQAGLWLISGYKVCQRHQSKGYDGHGLELISSPTQLKTGAKLWTKFQPSCREWRVNVWKDLVLGGQKKVEATGKIILDQNIRTGSNGWGFQLTPDVTKSVKLAAVQAVKALGLDFGGVDILEDGNGLVYVLEVNTAPELTPHLVMKVAETLLWEAGYDV